MARSMFKGPKGMSLAGIAAPAAVAAAAVATAVRPPQFIAGVLVL